MTDSRINISGRRRVPLIRQAEAAECGLASIAMIASYHGYEVDLATLRRRFPISMSGTTLKTIIDVAGALGLASRPIRCEISDLHQLRKPALLHWGNNHFVVLTAFRFGKAIIHDPAHGLLSITAEVLSSHFTGVALELTPTPAFKPKRDLNPLRLTALVSFDGAFFRSMAIVAALSLIIEVFVLLSPFYLQFVIDDAIMKGDLNILNVLAIAFSFVVIFKAISIALRSLATQFISSSIALEMKDKLFSHLIRLPLDWFQKRQIGDIQSRFTAARSIQNFISQGALTGIIDGILGFVVLAMMLLYTVKLTLFAIVSVLTYMLVRFATYHTSRRYASDVIITDAREQTRFLESLRAAQTIKSAGAEMQRDVQYRNLTTMSVNAQIKSSNISVLYKSLDFTIAGIVDILIIFFGARLVIAADLTVGMLTAFLAYKGQFILRFTNMTDQLFAWRLLDVQLERLSDVALSPRENKDEYVGFVGEIQGQLACQNLSYRYGYGETPVFSNLNIKVEMGECVAIVGKSGCGKSTLAKVMVGLYTPTFGEVSIDSKPLKRWNNKCIREQVSFISQEDQLLAGTIAENVALFSDHIDMAHVRHCADIAQIDLEVNAMPMGYDSLVGDMGSSLSSGQKQRLLIARALYKNPRIIVMDEATAHLDISNEILIGVALSKIQVTRIIIAHRPETIAQADRVIHLSGGMATSFPSLTQEEVRNLFLKADMASLSAI